MAFKHPLHMWDEAKLRLEYLSPHQNLTTLLQSLTSLLQIATLSQRVCTPLTKPLQSSRLNPRKTPKTIHWRPNHTPVVQLSLSLPLFICTKPIQHELVSCSCPLTHTFLSHVCPHGPMQHRFNDINAMHLKRRPSSRDRQGPPRPQPTWDPIKAPFVS